MLSCIKARVTIKLLICPGCHSVVDPIEVNKDAVGTQRKTWHRECYEQFVVATPDPMTFCPWCTRGFTATDETLVSRTVGGTENAGRRGGRVFKLESA